MAGARETFIVDEPEGSTIGILIDLPDGSQVWSGEASGDLFAKQGEDVRDNLVDGGGQFVIVAAKGHQTEIVCRAASIDAGIQIARAIAHSFFGAPMPPPREPR